MRTHVTELSKIGWHFDNSYARLPEIMSTKLSPVPVNKPKLVVLNDLLSKEIGLNFSNISDESKALLFSGNLLPKGSESIAQAYAGHQFGHFTMLGDGRAIIIGEHLAPDNKRVDIQFKGSGKTPYSRGGDGRAALSPMLREYIISEAMHSLRIPTTRSLAVVTTGQNVIRESILPGAILTRVASSHIRVGTFQYVSAYGDLKILKSLTDYTINRHYPDIKSSNNPPLSFLKAVMEKQIELITNWMRVGFIHGVMNTDNMAISGETIDYGPCAFMDFYDPETVFSSIDHNGRYAYFNQPGIAKWNLLRFAETLLPLIDENKDKAAEIAQDTINNFGNFYNKSWFEMMKKKIGLFGEEKNDEILINDLLSWMHSNKADFTNTFYYLTKQDFFNEKIYQDKKFLEWKKRWEDRMKRNNKPKESSFEIMKKNNPVIIPRNYKVEEALELACKNSDLSSIYNLIKILKNPYLDQKGIADYQTPPKPSIYKYQTFCGT